MYILGPFLLVVACGVSTTVGRTYCSRGEAAIVIAQWTQAFGIGGNVDPMVAVRGTTRLFVGLMKMDPKIKSLFARVNPDDVQGAEFSAHVMRVLVGFDQCVNALQNIPVLEEITSHLAKQHAARAGVKKEYLYRFFDGTVMVMPLLTDKFNSDAWFSCVVPIFDAITAGLP